MEPFPVLAIVVFCSQFQGISTSSNSSTSERSSCSFSEDSLYTTYSPDTDSYTEGERVSIHCRFGYKFVRTELTCTDKTWSTDSLTCELSTETKLIIGLAAICAVLAVLLAVAIIQLRRYSWRLATELNKEQKPPRHPKPVHLMNIPPRQKEAEKPSNNRVSTTSTYMQMDHAGEHNNDEYESPSNTRFSTLTSQQMTVGVREQQV